MDDRLIGIDDLALYLGIPKATLYDWRKTKRGPPRTCSESTFGGG